MEITFSIPVYNDEKTINALIQECILVGNQLKLKMKILIIEDGSLDNTKLEVEKIVDKYDFVEAIYHDKNMSFGPTLKEVFTVPTTDWICFLPGDHQFSPAAFLKPAMHYVNDYKYIIGYRINRADNINRKIVSRFLNFFVSSIARKQIKDVNSSVLFRKEIRDDLSFKSNSAFVHAELFLHANKKGHAIIEIPIEHKKREFGKAGGNTFKVVYSTIRDLIKYVFT